MPILDLPDGTRIGIPEGPELPLPLIFQMCACGPDRPESFCPIDEHAKRGRARDRLEADLRLAALITPPQPWRLLITGI